MRVSFGRIIPVISISAPVHNTQTKRVDNSTYDIAKVLNGEKTSAYSKSEAKSIKNYFKSILGDYNGQNGVLMKKTSRGDIVLISGNDAQTIKEIEKSKEKNPQKTQSTIETLIYTKLENGNGKKPESQIILGSSQLSTKDLTTAQLTGKSPIKAKINKFKYSCYQTFYTAKIDGAIRKDILPTDKETCQTKCANAVAEYKELNL